MFIVNVFLQRKILLRLHKFLVLLITTLAFFKIKWTSLQMVHTYETYYQMMITFLLLAKLCTLQCM